jgi:hypothetical protein
MNRSNAAKLLIKEGAPAGVCDNMGNSALCLLIERIPEVALKAMDQFHSVDTINRKEFYFLNYLEGTKLTEQKTPARTPLEIAVQNERFDIIMHPVMQRLIAVKWQMYGKWGAILDLVVNLVYTILWTVLAVTLPRHGRDLYIPLTTNIWRLFIVGILVLLTLVEIKKQIFSKLGCLLHVANIQLEFRRNKIYHLGNTMMPRRLSTFFSIEYIYTHHRFKLCRTYELELCKGCVVHNFFNSTTNVEITTCKNRLVTYSNCIL